MATKKQRTSGTQLVARLAARLMRMDRPFLAPQLARQIIMMDTTWVGFADRLGCTTGELNSLACCQVPRPDRFDTDLMELAGYTGIDETSLRQLLRSIMTTELID